MKVCKRFQLHLTYLPFMINLHIVHGLQSYPVTFVLMHPLSPIVPHYLCHSCDPHFRCSLGRRYRWRGHRSHSRRGHSGCRCRYWDRGKLYHDCPQFLILTVSQITKVAQAKCVKTKCKPIGWSAGKHCGDGLLGCSKSHLYQVSKDKDICDYGFRKSCKKCGKLSCPKD